MAFNIFRWLLGATDPNTGDAVSPESERVTVSDFLDTEGAGAIAGLEIYLQRMAFWTCVRKIGAAVAACEFQTVRTGKKVQAREYWAWNYEPNPNQSKSQFIQHLIGNLYLHQEALVVETRLGYRYVADSWTEEKHLEGNIYQDIVADGQSIPGTFGARDVLRFTIEGDKIRAMLLGLAASEGKLMKSAANSFMRGNGTRGTLKIDDLAESDPDFEETYADLVNEKFKTYFTSENAVLPLFNGYDYEEESSGSKTQQATTRDIRAMMDDIMDYTARALGVPVSICTGTNASGADFKEFMSSTVKPLADMIAQELNRKLFGQRQVLNQRTYVVVDMANVRYTDLFDVANPIDKLIGSGAFCVNDIRIRLGLDVIDEPWASQHWMTKNYSTVEDLNRGLDGDSNINNPEGPDEPEEPEEKEVTTDE